LEFVNGGGTRKAVVTAYRQDVPRVDERIVQEDDVTSDGVPELLVSANGSLVAFVCMHGQYQLKGLIGETYHHTRPIILTITDMNLDGVDEILAMSGDDRVRYVGVVAWDGVQFQLLNWNEAGRNPDICYTLYGPSWAYARDTDGDGVLELVLEQAIPIWTEYYDGMPWREETRTCTWNGVAFVHTQTEIVSPPEYRFQAVQDGDRASLAGDLARALDLYQQAIFSDQLDWWSRDRFWYELESFEYRPTPIPSLQPDPAEYPALAAYARYRIMLLHVLRGYESDAQVVFNTLQEKFPPGQPGHAHAEMATAFWIEYQASNDTEQACARAIEYAAAHPADILACLGNGEFAAAPYGSQSLVYTPADVCSIR
jgi:hypothetical protein